MKKAYFLPRALVLFLAFLLLGAGMFRYAHHHYKNVASWGEADSTRVLIYEGETYYLAGLMGERGLNAKTYPAGDVLGEVTPKNFLDKTPALVVHSVEGKDDYLILIMGEDEKYLYFHEKVDNPAETETVGT